MRVSLTAWTSSVSTLKSYGVKFSMANTWEIKTKLGRLGINRYTQKGAKKLSSVDQVLYDFERTF